MHIPTAKIAATMADKAYERYPAAAKVVQVRTAKAIIVRNMTEVWIAIEGTRPSFWDWLKNFATAQIPFYGLMAHAGCALEAKYLLPLIEKEIDHEDTIYITGHSQGGGVAVLVAWVLHSRYDIRAGYGFAPMRSLSRRSAKTFNKVLGNRWWSIALRNDIVPHVPPAIRYGNVGQGMFFNDAGALVHGIPTPIHYVWEIIRMAFKKTLPQMWKDHDIKNYLAALARL